MNSEKQVTTAGKAEIARTETVLDNFAHHEKGKTAELEKKNAGLEPRADPHSDSEPRSGPETESQSDSDSDSDSDVEAPKFTRRVKTEEAQIKPGRRQQTLDMAQSQTPQVQIGEDDVDDTDGLDPVAELDAWKQREQARVQREYEQLEAIENEVQHKMESRRKRLKQEPSN